MLFCVLFCPFVHTYDSRGLIAIIMSYWVIIRHGCCHKVAFLCRKHFLMTFSPLGWKILIRWLWSDDHSYCNFLRKIRFRSSLAHRKTPCGVKSAFLGRKPHFQGWKNQFFAIFHPGDILDPQFDPGIGFYAQNYNRNHPQMGSSSKLAVFTSGAGNLTELKIYCTSPF